MDAYRINTYDCSDAEAHWEIVRDGDIVDDYIRSVASILRERLEEGCGREATRRSRECYMLRPSPIFSRNGSLTGLLFFRASNSVYDRVSTVSHRFCINGARAGSNRFLVLFLQQ